MKKIISVFLSIVLLVSVLPATVFATPVTEEMQMQFLDKLNSVGNPAEVRKMLEENEWAVELCENYSMYMDADNSRLEEIANLMYALSIRSMDEFVYRLDQSIVLAYINLAVGYGEIKDLIEIHADLLGIDMYGYNKLTEQQKIMAMKELYEYQFMSADELADRFYDVVNNAMNDSSKPSGGGSGSSGGGGGYIPSIPSGGGGYSSVWSYTYDTNGNVMNEPPADGTDVLLKLQVRYQGTPCTYTIGLYDSEGAMKAVATFDSYASQKGESQFYEFETKYFSGCEIRTFSMESMDSFVPVDDVQFESFFFGDEIPEPETETEGITAYRGYIENLYADSFDLIVHDKREFGYWGAEHGLETITVKGMCPEIVIYMENPDTVYNIKEVDGEYYLDSADYEGEIKTVLTKDIYSFDGVNLEFYDNNTPVSYTVNPESLYSYYERYFGNVSDLFNCEEVVYLYIVDGEIRNVHALSSYAEKIVRVGRGMAVTADGGIYPLDEMVGYIPEAGDVIIITPLPEYCSGTVKAEKLSGRYFTDMFMDDDGNYYDLKYFGNQDFYGGEKCVGYLDTETNTVKYVEKVPKDVIFVEKCHYDEMDDKLEIRTQNGVIDISNARFVDFGVTYNKPADIFARLECEIPGVYQISEYNDRKYIEPTMRIYEGSARYFAQTNTLGGYILGDDIEIVAWDGEEFIENITLTSGATYDIHVYSKDGTSADYIIINDYENRLSQQTVTMIVSSVTRDVENNCWYIDGYKDSEEYRIKTEAWFSTLDEVKPGDVVKASIDDGEVINMELVAQARYHEMMEERGPHSLFAPVRDVSENVLVMESNMDGSRYIMVIDDRTDIYMYDWENDTVTPAEISDIIFTYPSYVMGGFCDWALVYTTGGISANNLLSTEIILIVPDNRW